MDRFRLFRSRAFWFGVPGLVFLLWGWWDSMGDRSGVDFGLWGVGQSAGDVYAYCFSDGWPDSWEVETFQYQVEPEEALEWKIALIDPPHPVPDLRSVFIPYQLLVPCFLAGWAGLLIWRKRKFEKRLIE
jgi:hypothetical protein